LAARLAEQAELRRQRQQQQQQRLPKGQLPPDQQAELDNSLNTLSLVLLRLWLQGCAVDDKLLQLPTLDGPVSLGSVLGLGMRCSKQHVRVAQHVELMLLYWPKADAAGSNADAPPTSSSSSTGHSRRSEPVRYGKLVLQWLPQVTYVDALPVALAAAQQLAVFNDAVQLVVDPTQPIHCEPNSKEKAKDAGDAAPAVHDARGDMTDRSVLALQLLLLACQAKVHWYGVAERQQRRSLVRNMVPGSLQQQQQGEQQQQQQLIAADTIQYLRLQDGHNLLLESYRCKDADIAALLKEHQQN
jgi:hypothetical protein